MKSIVRPMILSWIGAAMGPRTGPIAWVVILGGIGMGCMNVNSSTPVASAQSSVQSIAASADNVVLEGCGWVDVSLHQNTSPSVAISHDENCGPLRITLDSSASFDHGASRLRLPLTVRLQGDLEALSPVLLIVWADSTLVLNPPVQSGDSLFSSVALVNSDSLVTEVGSSWAGASIWRLERTTETSGATQVFGPRVLELKIPEDVSRIGVPVRIRADRDTIVVPDEVPDSVPADLYDHIDEAYGVPQNFLLVMFDPAATREQKRAAIRVTGGEVAGGFPFTGEGPLAGYYLVRIPTDGTIGPTLRALDRLYEMPGVISAGLDFPLDVTSRERS